MPTILAAQDPQEVCLLAGFEHEESIKQVRLANSSQEQVTLDPEYATQGQFALHFFAPKYAAGMQQWPVLQFRAGETFIQCDWSAYDYFACDLVNASDEQLQLNFYISSTDSFRDGYRTQIKLGAWEHVPVDIPVRDIAVGMMQDGKPGKQVQIEAIRLIHCFLTRPTADVHVHFDGLRLVKGKPDHTQARERVTPALVAQLLDTGVMAQDIQRCRQIQARLGSSEQHQPGRVYVQGEVLRLQGLLGALYRRCIEEQLSLDEARSVAQTAKAQAVAVQRLELFAAAWLARPAASCGIGVADSMDFVYPRDLPFNCSFTGPGQLALAKGEYENLQLAVFAYGTALSRVRVELSVLTGPNGCAVDVQSDLIQVTVHPVGFVNVKPNTFYKSDYIGWTPDPILSYMPAVDVAAGTVQPFWVEVYAAAEALPGKYHGQLVVHVAGGYAEMLPFEFEVWPFTISGQPLLPTAITSNTHNMLDAVYGPSEAERLRTTYVKFLRRFMIMSDHIYRKVPPTVAELQALAEQNALGLFNIMYVGLNDFDRQKPDTWLVELARIKDVVGAALKQYRAAGLDRFAYLYCFDEVEAEAFPMVKQLLSEIKAAFPNLPIMTTLRDSNYGSLNGLDALIYIWTPSLLTYNPELATQARAKGNQVWWYIYCSVAHPYPNWFNEYPPIDTRVLMGPMSYKFKTDGFLYYAINRWHDHGVMDDGPYSQWDPGTYKGASGDGSLFYPGPEGPLASIRMHNYRDGVEDYNMIAELQVRLEVAVSRPSDPLWQQAVAAAEQVLHVPDSIVTSLTSYTQDAVLYRQWRADVAQAILQLDSLIS